MDDTFAYVAPVMPRRRLDPFALKLAACATAFVAMAGAFGVFVVRHERDSDRRAEVSREVAALPELRVAPAEPAPPVLGDVSRTAQQVLGQTGSLAGAGPGELASAHPDRVFVDGPSFAGSVISIEAARTVWAAAVMDASGVCHWVVLLASGAERQGSSHEGACVASEILAGAVL